MTAQDQPEFGRATDDLEAVEADAYEDHLRGGAGATPEEWIARHPAAAPYLAMLRVVYRLHAGRSEARRQNEPVPTIPGYRFESSWPLAVGGMGVVWVAVQERPERRVAVKLIRVDLAEDEAMRARFFQEANLAARLEHTGILPIFEVGEASDGRPFYSMRLYGDVGVELNYRIEQFHSRQLPRAQWFSDPEFRALLNHFVSACQTVDYAHEREPPIIHNDITPRNILVSGHNETVVIDWGLAKDRRSRVGAEGGPTDRAASDAGGRPGSRAGDALGTAGFWSPEQARGEGYRADRRTDVYWLGATLQAIVTGDWKPIGLRGRTRDALAGLMAISSKAMKPEPDDRYQSARELAADVERWLADEPVSAYREPFPTRAWRFARRHITAVITAVAVFLVTGVGWFWYRHHEAVRLAQIAGQVESAFDEADRRTTAAQKAWPEPTPWTEAVDAATRANDLAAVSGSPSLLRSTRRRLYSLASERDRASKVSKLLADLDEARLSGAEGRTGSFDIPWMLAEVRRVLADADIDVEALAVEESARRISDTGVGPALAVVLDECMLRCDDLALRRKLRAITRLVDPDPTRDGIREAFLLGEGSVLKRFAGSLDLGRQAQATIVLLGIALSCTAGCEQEAAMLLQRAHHLRPSDFWIVATLAELHSLKDKESWVRYASTAVALRPNSPTAHFFLGNALRFHDDPEGASTEFRLALLAKRDYSEARFCLGLVLVDQGRFGDGLVDLKRAHEMGSSHPVLRSLFAEWVSRVEPLAELERRLPAILRGTERPKDDEKLAFAEMAYMKGLYVGAAQLQGEALAARPALAKDLVANHRYNAACYSALAGTREGKDDPPPNEVTRARFRHEAIERLKTDLDARKRRQAADQRQNWPAMAQTLRHWQADADLAGLRDEAELAKLPASERAACRALWDEVRAILRQAE